MHWHGAGECTLSRTVWQKKRLASFHTLLVLGRLWPKCQVPLCQAITFQINLQGRARLGRDHVVLACDTECCLRILASEESYNVHTACTTNLTIPKSREHPLNRQVPFAILLGQQVERISTCMQPHRSSSAKLRGAFLRTDLLVGVGGGARAGFFGPPSLKEIGANNPPKKIHSKFSPKWLGVPLSKFHAAKVCP